MVIYIFKCTDLFNWLVIQHNLAVFVTYLGMPLWQQFLFFKQWLTLMVFLSD